jgi:hypothetical protein
LPSSTLTRNISGFTPLIVMRFVLGLLGCVCVSWEQNKAGTAHTRERCPVWPRLFLNCPFLPVQGGMRNIEGQVSDGERDGAGA